MLSSSRYAISVLLLSLMATAPVLGGSSGKKMLSTFPKQNGRCKIKNCDKCDSKFKKCVKCSWDYETESYGVTPKGQCAPCSSGCLKCSTSDKCTQCFPYYTLSNGKCIKCDHPGCSKCPKGPAICKSCQDPEQNTSYGLTPEKSCADCPDNCEYCEYANKCLSCESGFEVLPSGQCGPKCKVANCETCEEDPSICTQCFYGYGVTPQNTCDKCQEHCEQCTDVDKCWHCGGSYGALPSGQCGRCKDKNCFDCDNDTNVCTNCKDGYRVTAANTCAKCLVKNCNDCWQDTNYCLSCADGYANSGSGSGKCVKCTPNCTVCGYAWPSKVQTCVACANGYRLSKNLCVKSR